jgi:hypothetical protein
MVFEFFGEWADFIISLLLYPFMRILGLLYSDICYVYEIAMVFYNNFANIPAFATALINIFITTVFGTVAAGLILVSITIALVIRLLRFARWLKKMVFQWL